MENRPQQILNCIQLGFDVEIDVWYVNRKYYLGHDKPEYNIDYEFMINKSLWCHAKNHEAFDLLLSDKNINTFWHQTDDYVLTSNGFIWCYPGKELVYGSIAVMPETTEYSLQDLKKCYAICTDYPLKYKEILLN